MWHDNRLIYLPPPYRPRMFPRWVRWTFYAVICVLTVLWLVGFMWVCDFLYHYAWK